MTDNDETNPVYLEMEAVSAKLEILFNTIIPHLTEVVHQLATALPCKQFQLISMDVESITQHLQDLHTHGPAEPFVDLPLEASEVEEVFEEEKEMTEEESEEAFWKEPEHGGPSQGDMMASSEWNK